MLFFFFSPGPTSPPPLFLPFILGNENNLFNDGSSLSLVTDLLGEFLLSSAENGRLGCGSHLWVGEGRGGCSPSSFPKTTATVLGSRMGPAGRVPTTAGGFSAEAVPAALAPGFWDQMRGLQRPPEPPTPSPSLSWRPAGVPGAHRLLPDLCQGARAWLGCSAGVGAGGQRSCTQGGSWEQRSGLHTACSHVPPCCPVAGR